MDTNKVVIGILAHVDSGKTTLAENLLYLGGSIRKIGRVDHKDAFLDTYELERARGITIFSKQAELKIGNKEVTLLDTPGHIDFSAEMERTLQVLDYAILVINASDGIQGHTEVLWKLLSKYEIPVFIFINKMDQEGTDKIRIIDELRSKLDGKCIDFNDDNFLEEVAMCDEEVLNTYLEKSEIDNDNIIKLIKSRKVFPCYFGSALKNIGINQFFEALSTYIEPKKYSDEFGAKVFKISRDKDGNRLTHIKITGGVLKARMSVTTDEIEEKVNQIRIYSGASFKTVSEAQAGCICAVTGLNRVFTGDTLGADNDSFKPTIVPVLKYKVNLPENTDIYETFLKLKMLEEEEPLLNIVYIKNLNEINVQVMGEIQIEILKSIIEERFKINVEFDEGNILYKETIKEAVEGVGHYEPLKHYAEVHLLMEPMEIGSGLKFCTDCSEDMLEGRWQRLILTHLAERKHKGVLTGSDITDMKITVIAGRAHLKHTEGGDFRQATYRAVRQGLRKAESVLLEPIYEFKLEVPNEMVGRAISDIQKMQGSFENPETDEEMSIICGSAPVINMQGYQREVIAYTKGRGRIFYNLKGYEPCHNSEEIISKIGYNPANDLENPCDSVFCSHGAGFNVSYDKVEEYMHVESPLKVKKEVNNETKIRSTIYVSSDKELEEIFVRTYGKSKRDNTLFDKKETYDEITSVNKVERKDEYLLVDGYNIIFAWDDLKELAKDNIEAARNSLIDILCNYQGYKKYNLILVFDAYKVKNNAESVEKHNNITIIYTKEAETADQYIEKTVHKIGKKYNVKVATSDALEQIIILGRGATRISAREFKEEIDSVNSEIRMKYIDKYRNTKNYLFDNTPEDILKTIEKIRNNK